MPVHPHQRYSLPAQPDLKHLKHQAADLRRAFTAGDADAIAAVQEVLRQRDSAPDDAEAPPRRSLSVARSQFVLARQYGFRSWPALREQVLALSAPGVATDAVFDAAARAVVDGDADTLARLLQEHPSLPAERSRAEHRCTLLHYVAANGIEDAMQRTPSNAVMICRMLLNAGSDVDALAQTYGGGSAQTTLCLLVSSVHPHRAGLQPDLVKTLCDAGAAPNGLDNDGAPLTTAIAFGYRGAATMLVACGARVDTLLAAAALGDISAVDRYLACLDDPSRSPELVQRERRAPYLRQVNTPREVLDRAFWYACAHDRLGVAARLLAVGADVAARCHGDFTPLHDAAARGSRDTIAFLLGNGAPLEAKVAAYNATVLDLTCWTAVNAPRPGVDYASVAAMLLDAGADPAAVSPRPTGLPSLDAQLARRR